MRYPDSVEKLISHFNRLPGIGPKTAERLVLSLLRRQQNEVIDFANALEAISTNINYCSQCYNISEDDPCHICNDPIRDHKKLLITAKPQDLIAIEVTNEYNGHYHILWGYLSPLEGKTPDQLKLNELMSRIDKMKELDEIILAFNLNMEGESTILYIYKMLKDYGIKISRLGRGLSMGSELEYADDNTIMDALNTRTELY